MIITPLKLNLILKSSDDLEINSTHGDQFKKIDTLENISNPNKLKNIVLEMRPDETKFLCSEESSGIKMMFEVTNRSRINEENYEDYICSNGLLGPINVSLSNELKKTIGSNVTYLVIQPIDEKYIDSDIFINKWKKDRNNFEQFIPEIFFYGNVYNNTGEFLSSYYITKKYFDHKDIIKLTWTQTLDYFKDILSMLDTVVKYKFVYKNISMFGLGFDIEKSNDSNSEQIVVKILKYNSTSLLSLEDEYFKQFELTKCFGKNCIGNLIPFYVIDDFYGLRNDWLNRLDKSYSLGLVEIIFVLFYNNSETLNKLYEFVVGPSILESRLQYFHMHKRFSSSNNKFLISDMVNRLELRFCDANPLFESALESILLNLLDCDYETIYYPYHILVIIEKIEESNDEFKINKNKPKTNVYIPKDDNYIKANYPTKINIIKDDDLSTKHNYLKQIDLLPKENEPDSLVDLINSVDLTKFNKVHTKEKNEHFKNLYLKYKLKYIKLKNTYV
jgi:hypothetical protein